MDGQESVWQESSNRLALRLLGVKAAVSAAQHPLSHLLEFYAGVEQSADFETT